MKRRSYMEGLQDENAVWDIDVASLIKLVQHYPLIYDHGHSCFKNSALRESTWAKIAAALKVPVLDCMRVWKNIRDKYTRERRTIMSTHSQDNIPLSKWEFYDAMKFLNPFIKRRRTLTLRKKPTPHDVQIDVNESSRSYSSPTHSRTWETLKLSPESFSLLEEDFESGSPGIEEVTFETEAEEATPVSVKNVVEQPTPISIIRHQTSEEAFGAYIATRLMEFPLEIRQIKKAKLFKQLEEPEEV